MSGAALARADSAGAVQALTLDALLARAARAMPDTLALAGGGAQQSWTFATLNAEVARVAGRLAALDLGGGAPVLIAGAASPHTLIAALAAQRAGLRAALAPLSFGADSLAAASAACGAIALIGAGGHAFGDVPGLLTDAAVAARQVRVVASCGAETGNGIVNLDEDGDSAALDHAAESLPLLTFARAPAGLTPVAQDAAKLTACAQSLQRAWPADDSAPVLSTLAPVTLAGLASGPMAAWLSGRALWLHGPFEAQVFARMLARAGRAHVVAPAGLESGIGASSACASVTLLHRRPTGSDPAPARASAVAPDQQCRLIDFFAIGECHAIAFPRYASDREQHIGCFLT